MDAPLPPVPLRPSLHQALTRGLSCLVSLQRPEGCWEAEVVWCPMLSAQYLITAFVMGQELDDARKEAIYLHFRAWQLEDGSFGMHAQSPGYLFVTTMVYVSLRLSGLSPDDTMVKRARAFLDAQGGVLAIPSWGKLWLAILNLYDWSGVYPVLPELWLLPHNHVAHPRRYYCHTRLIYLAIGVLYGLRYQTPMRPVLHELRQELYPTDYNKIDFPRAKSKMAKRDMFVYPALPVRLAYTAGSLFNRYGSRKLRSKAIRHCSDHIRHHLQSSRHASISPVNGLLNTLALFAQDHEDPDALASFRGVDYWIWQDHEGIRFNGARSHTWDSAFAVQAIEAATTGEDAPKLDDEVSQKSAHYFLTHQMQDEMPQAQRETYYRDILLGGFCFSDRHHRWPVSDCTGEALAAMEFLKRRGQDIPNARFLDGANFVLSRQNKDGGWGSYEKNRGNLLLESLNPSEMFGNCMVEHSYIECTASCIRGLVSAKKACPDMPQKLKVRIDRAISRGAALLASTQHKDGSWAGFWGVNYSYGTMFGISGLIDAGASTQDKRILRARRFLLRTQLADGGWGERWESCVQERYIPSEESQVIMTSWAMMGLILAGERSDEVLGKAAQLIMSRQLPSGDWPKEGVGGVFFNTAMHHYMMYKNYFPVWALGMYRQLQLS